MCVIKTHYFVLFRRVGAFFSPSPEQMNLDASSSASPIMTTATSPSLPSSQLTVLLLAEEEKHTGQDFHPTARTPFDLYRLPAL